MRDIILPGDEACPGCSRDAILVSLCPCLATYGLSKSCQLIALPLGEIFYIEWPKEACLDSQHSSLLGSLSLQ